MDEFVGLIEAFVGHTDDFEQAHETLYNMIEETPDDFINNLLTIITTTSDSRLLINCINMLTIPITKSNGSFIKTVNSSNLQIETKNNIKQILISLFIHSQKEIGDAASRVLCFYVQFASEEKRDLIKHLISLIDPTNYDSINLVFLETLNSLCKRIFFDSSYSIEAVIHLCNIFSTFSEGNTDPKFPEKEKLFISIVGELCHCINTFEDHQDDLMNVVAYIWTLTKEKYPVEGLESIKPSMVNFGQLFAQIPDFVDGVFSFLQSDDEKIRYHACQLLNCRTYVFENGGYHCHSFLSEGREIEILGILINFIVNDENTSLPENDSFTKVCINVLISHIFFSFSILSEPLLQYFFEHIGSEQESERFASLILYDAYLDKDFHPPDEVKEPLSGIITTFLQDSSERIIYTTFFLFEKTIFRELITITDELHEIVTQLCCSPSEEISSEAFEVLFVILTKTQNKDMKDQTGVESARYILQYISTEIDDDNRRADILRKINRICKEFKPETALTMVEASLEFASDLLSQVEQTDSEPIVPLSLSPSIGFVYSVFTKACQSTNEETIQSLKSIASDLFQFATQLIENNFTSDGLLLIESLMKLFNGEEDSILSFALDFINQNFSTTENKEDFSTMLLICQQLIPFLTQENHSETLIMILETCLNYGHSSDINIDLLSDANRLIINIIILIYNQYPDIVIEQLHQCIDLFYPGGIRISSVTTENVIKFIISVSPNFEEDTLYARAVSDALFHLGSQVFHKNNGTYSDEDLITLLTAAHVTDPSGQIVHTVLNYYASNYNTNIVPNIKNKELLPQILSLLPEIPEPNHVVIISN